MEENSINYKLKNLQLPKCQIHKEYEEETCNLICIDPRCQQDNNYLKMMCQLCQEECKHNQQNHQSRHFKKSIREIIEKVDFIEGKQKGNKENQENNNNFQQQQQFQNQSQQNQHLITQILESLKHFAKEMKIISEKSQKICDQIKEQIEIIKSQSQEFISKSKQIINNIVNPQTTENLQQNIDKLQEILQIQEYDQNQQKYQFEFNNKNQYIQYQKFNLFVSDQVQQISKKVDIFFKSVQKSNGNNNDLNELNLRYQLLSTFDDKNLQSDDIQVKKEGENYLVSRQSNICTMDFVISDQPLSNTNHKFGIKFLQNCGSNQCFGIIQKQKALEYEFTLPNFCRDKGHGAYLLNYNDKKKYVYSSTDEMINDKQIGFGIDIGEVLICEYDCVSQLLKFSQQGQEDQKFISLKVDNSNGQQYHLCIVLCCSSDRPQVEFFNIL